VDRYGARQARPKERAYGENASLDHKKKRRGRLLVATPCVLVRRDLPGSSSDCEDHPAIHRSCYCRPPASWANSSCSPAIRQSSWPTWPEVLRRL